VRADPAGPPPGRSWSHCLGIARTPSPFGQWREEGDKHSVDFRRAVSSALGGATLVITSAPQTSSESVAPPPRTADRESALRRPLALHDHRQSRVREFAHTSGTSATRRSLQLSRSALRSACGARAIGFALTTRRAAPARALSPARVSGQTQHRRGACGRATEACPNAMPPRWRAAAAWAVVPPRGHSRALFRRGAGHGVRHRGDRQGLRSSAISAWAVTHTGVWSAARA